VDCFGYCFYIQNAKTWQKPLVQIKLEQQNIKERLNLHVKRRLQQDADNPAESPELLPTDANAKRSKTKDVSKPRKPYQKRTEKPKTEATKCKKGI